MSFDVFHNWAHNVVGPRGGQTSKGNVYFDPSTRTIYSYGSHFPMGRFVQNAQGNTAVVITRRTYSSTTAHHISCTYSAVSHQQVFEVPNVEPRADFQNWSAAYFAYLDDATDSLAKAKRARKYASSYLESARHCLAKAQALSDFAGLGHTVDFSLDANGTLAARVAAQEEARKEAARLEHERETAQRELDKAKFQAWLAGDDFAESADIYYRSYCPASYRTDQNGSAYLRTKDDEVQTSLHASVPLNHAIRAYRFVKLCRMTGRTYKTNGHSVRVGHFTLDSIDAKGNVKIGCHYITWERINEWAERQGIAGESATDEALTANVQEGV